MLLWYVFVFYFILERSNIGSDPVKQPTDQEWPEIFVFNFNETFYVSFPGERYTHGTYFYDYIKRCSRIDRVNGYYDFYCGSSELGKATDTPCSHLVIDRMRWLVYPELK